MSTSLWDQRRIILLTIIIDIGTLLIGYDAGVYGSALVMPSFVEKFNFTTNPTKAAALGGNTVTFYYLGAIASPLVIVPASVWLGRRNSLFMASFFLVIGGILQTISQSLPMIYGGRVISGFGSGCSATVGPMYLAECATKEHRTASVSSVQLSVVIGAAISYWVGFGVGKWNPTNLQWRFLIGFQVILAGMYFIGIFFLPESPRHLAWLHVKEEANRRRGGLPTLPRFPENSGGKKISNPNDKADSDSKSITSDAPHAGIETLHSSSSSFPSIAHTLVDRIFFGRTKPATALSALAYLRNRPMSSQAVLSECAEIYAAVDEAEAELVADGGIRNVLLRKRGTFFRLLATVWVGIWQGQTGQVILLSYAPIVLKSLGLSSTTISLVASGAFTMWESVCVAFAVFFGLQRIGRVRMLTIGGIGAGLIFFMIAAIEATHPSDPLATSPSKASIAMVFLIYLWVPFFCICIGPSLWLVGSEVCTGSLRELGQGIFTMFTWASAAQSAKTIPIGLVSIGWKTWLIPAVVNFCFGVGAWVVMPETKGKTIEEMDVVFGAIDQDTRATHIQQVLREEKAAILESA
ncbi:hypothetical protein FRB98_007713 [Tulasnella sp. 332]|nr:hypothetical protein FRB98_007713 [Tulasnella sp. 332]